jgi:hypothetical protein
MDPDIPDDNFFRRFTPRNEPKTGGVQRFKDFLKKLKKLLDKKQKHIILRKV